LALLALRELPEWNLLMVGSGPDRERLRRLARRWHLDGRARFIDRLPRAQLLRLMRDDADVLIFPSLREDAGWVVAEALACGLPVVCLDRGGPPILGAKPVPHSTITETASRFAMAIRELTDSNVVREIPSFELNERRRRVAGILRTRSGSRALRLSQLLGSS
jgi:glycosyltransferase involved in cell wall biosynthesis